MILCDTNILVEIYRNNPSVNAAIDRIGHRNIAISDVARAEILLGARNKHELQIYLKSFQRLMIYPILPDISGEAINLLIHFRLSHGLDFMDALHAATALHHGLEFYTLNVKDFIFIPGIVLYRPQDSR